MIERSSGFCSLLFWQSAAIDGRLRLLQDLPGTEFAVVHADPPSLFIIHKREGERGIKHRLLASYVILDSVIYQSPSVYDYASTKLVRC